jgi:hypothetical protein
MFGSQSFINQSFSNCLEFISLAVAYSTPATAHNNNATQSHIFHFLGDFCRKLLAILSDSYHLIEAHQIHFTASRGSLTKLLKVAIGIALKSCHLDI